MSAINISATIISEIQALESVAVEGREPILALGLNILEGTASRDSVLQVSSEQGVEFEIVSSIANASANLIWELARGGQRDVRFVVDILTQASLSPPLVEVFLKVYKENRTRIANVKSNITLSGLRFKDLSWRLDVELGRRNISSITEPKFMVRLDVSRESRGEKVESFHLQADYANMKRLQNELQRALNEMQSVHAQRLSRYIT